MVQWCSTLHSNSTWSSRQSLHTTHFTLSRNKLWWMHCYQSPLLHSAMHCYNGNAYIHSDTGLLHPRSLSVCLFLKNVGKVTLTINTDCKALRWLAFFTWFIHLCINSVWVFFFLNGTWGKSLFSGAKSTPGVMIDCKIWAIKPITELLYLFSTDICLRINTNVGSWLHTFHGSLPTKCLNTHSMVKTPTSNESFLPFPVNSA